MIREVTRVLVAFFVPLGTVPFGSVCASAIVIIGGYRASDLNRRQVMKNSSWDAR